MIQVNIIQGLNKELIDIPIIIGFDTNVSPRVFTISISKIEGELKKVDVFLKDKLLNITHNLKTTDYQFEQKITGEFINRFELMLSGIALDVDEELSKKTFIISNVNGNLKINSYNLVHSIKVYDLLGRVLIKDKPGNKSFILKTTHLKQGTILLIEAVLENGSVVKRKTIQYVN